MGKIYSVFLNARGEKKQGFSKQARKEHTLLEGFYSPTLSDEVREGDG